jgi:hypothetical protein
MKLGCPFPVICNAFGDRRGLLLDLRAVFEL